jgi:hypothetical protein
MRQLTIAERLTAAVLLPLAGALLGPVAAAIGHSTKPCAPPRVRTP